MAVVTLLFLLLPPLPGAPPAAAAVAEALLVLCSTRPLRALPVAVHRLQRPAVRELPNVHAENAPLPLLLKTCLLLLLPLLLLRAADVDAVDASWKARVRPRPPTTVSIAKTADEAAAGRAIPPRDRRNSLFM